MASGVQTMTVKEAKLFEKKGKIDMTFGELEAELNKCHSEAN